MARKGSVAQSKHDTASALSAPLERLIAATQQRERERERERDRAIDGSERLMWLDAISLLQQIAGSWMWL